jgi:hypothetical protein
VMSGNNPTGYPAGFLYRNQTILELNTLLDTDDRRWYIERANDINDKEEIAAIGILDGMKHAVLLIPVH